MALNQTGLADALEALFATHSDSKSDAADALAAAYVEYGEGGTFGASTVSLAPGESSLASAILAGMLDPPAGNMAAFAAAWGTGLAAIWTAAPVAGVQSGATNGCPGAVALPAALIAALSAPMSAAAAAAAIAGVLHTATLTVTATVSPPPATVLPIA